jgi:NAD(P)-dependent dehydrogenase (short-subunit alcohol dehydrogenase family)
MIDNQIIFIVGGLGLLGKAFSKCVVENGAKLIIGELHTKENIKQFNDLKQKLNSNKIEFIPFDISSESSIKKGFEILFESHPRIDAVVNTSYPRNKNFGNDLLKVNIKDFNENINLHLGGYFLTSQIAIKHFLKQGNGNLINIASIYGVIAPKFEIYQSTQLNMPVEYSVIKSGIIHLTKYLSKYLKGKNIRVNCISPGGIINNHSDIFKENYGRYTLNKGMLHASDLSGTLIYLLSGMGKFVNGQNIIVDDGFTL